MRQTIAIAAALLAFIETGADAQNARSIKLTVGQGELVQFAQDISKVVVAEPKIADAIVISPREVMVTAKGAGKTTLAKGIVSAFGAVQADDVASPTFTLIHDYGEVVHIDLYRLETEREVETLGLDEIIENAKLTLIEWGERFPNIFPEASTITLRTVSDTGREFEVQCFDGPHRSARSIK